jgi:peptide/nickel transport system substrate-binding protein
MLAALRTKEVDMAFGPPFGEARGLTRDGLEIKSALAASFGEMRLNIMDEPPDSPLRKKEVRQALNYATDKEALRTVAYGGFGKGADGQLIGSNTFGYNPALKPYEFDLAKARQLLATAGYPNGFSTKYAFVTSGAGTLFSEPMQAMWAQVGVRTEFVRMDLPALVAKNAAGNLDPMTWLGADAFPLFDAEPVLRLYSDSLPEPNRLWGNAAFQQLYLAQAQELDRAKREKLIRDALALMREEAPSIFLLQQEWVYALSPKIRGFEPRGDGAVFFDDMRKLR